MAKRLLAADLFCGAGGLSLGFASAGYEIVFANDIDVLCQHTYESNHPKVEFLPGSIEQLSVSGIRRRTGLRRGELDVLLGGPPCQGFSINAPVRRVADDRNHLFQHYGRLVLEGLHPKVVVMENVPGMLSLAKGRFVEAVYDLFRRAGYRMRHMVLCAAHYGIPQERWRLFLIGTAVPHVEIAFPKPTHWARVRANFTGGRELTWLRFIAGKNGGNANVQPTLFPEARELVHFITVKEAIDDLPELGIRDGQECMVYGRSPTSAYQKALRKASRRLYNHVSGALSERNLERLRYIRPGRSWRDIPFDLLPRGLKRARRSDHTRRYGRLDPEGLSGTILTKCDPHWGTFFHYGQNRTLTVREAARLQSFPDRFRFFGSRVSQYSQVGNAVPPKLAQAIAEHIQETFFG